MKLYTQAALAALINSNPTLVGVVLARLDSSIAPDREQGLLIEAVQALARANRGDSQ